MLCTKCNKDKGTDFRKNRKVCRECDNAAARERTKKLKKRQKPEFIICRVCKEKKTEFRINRRKCLHCERSSGRKYRQTTDKAKVWVQNNKERMSELQHQWYEKEKANILQKIKGRYKTDPDFKLGISHRAGVRHLVHGGKTSKYVNCTGVRLRNWLQFQLSDEMTFENYGDVWVIDHVIPIHTFLVKKYPAEIVLNWLNIRPVICQRNLTKNKHIDSDQCLDHLENIRYYTKIRNLNQDTEYISVLESICL